MMKLIKDCNITIMGEKRMNTVVKGYEDNLKKELENSKEI